MKILKKIIVFVFLISLSISELVAQGNTSTHNSSLKPRMIVLTDIAPNDFEPDDMESMVRLLVHADLFEIEGLIATTGWNDTGGNEHIELIYKALEAYEKDLPNLVKRSNQEKFLKDESRQEIGYWPSSDYLRTRTLMGSTKMGIKYIGEDNDSPGSDLIIKMADQDDDRPIWISAWGGANTLAQAIWRVKKERTDEQLKAFLHKIRVYTITDQDRPWSRLDSIPFSVSSHQWMRKEFEKDLLFIWDENAWHFQCDTGVKKWDEYAENIQGHGNLGKLYPKYKWGVEGDTPAFLHIMPVGISNPDIPSQASWGGCFTWDFGRDSATKCYTNKIGVEANSLSAKYLTNFYPAIFNNFAARMDWAKDGKGNTNPKVIIDGDESLGIINRKPKQGKTVILNASKSNDPDGDNLKFNWWIQPDAGTYKGNIVISNKNSSVAKIKIPADSKGKSFHVVCEVKDYGKHNLSSYRRIIFEPTK